MNYLTNTTLPKSCEPPGLLQESLGPFGSEVSPRVSPKTTGGVSGARVGPRAPECPKSVPGVSRSVRDTVFDTLVTLFEHSEPGPRRHAVGHSFQSRFSGRGCDEALFSEKKGFSVKRGEAIQ